MTTDEFTAQLAQRDARIVQLAADRQAFISDIRDLLTAYLTSEGTDVNHSDCDRSSQGPGSL